MCTDPHCTGNCITVCRTIAEGLIPQAGIVGDMRISYAKFLQLLEGNRIKRVVVYGDMKTAIVEVPHPWCVAARLGALCWAACTQLGCCTACARSKAVPVLL